MRCACFLRQRSQGRPQVGTVVTAKLETRDVVKDLGIELPVHTLRMQTFWNIRVSGFSSTRQCIAFQWAQFASVTAMSDQASLSPLLPPVPSLKSCKLPAGPPNAASTNLSHKTGIGQQRRRTLHPDAPNSVPLDPSEASQLEHLNHLMT